MKNIFAQFIFGLLASTLLVGNACSASENINNNASVNAEKARAELSVLVNKLNKVSEKNTVSTVSEIEDVLEIKLSKKVCEERAPDKNYSDCSYFSTHDESEVVKTIEFKPEPNRDAYFWYDRFRVNFNPQAYCVLLQDLEKAFQRPAIFHPAIKYNSEEDKQSDIQKYGIVREYYFPKKELRNTENFNIYEKNGCAEFLYFALFQSNEAMNKILSEEFERNYPIPKLKKIPYQHRLVLRTIQRTSSASMPFPQAKVRNLFTGKAICTHGSKLNEIDCKPRRTNSKASVYFSEYTSTPSITGKYLYEYFTWELNNVKHCIQERNLIKFFKKNSSPSRIHVIREPSIPEGNSLPPFFSDYEIILKNSHPYENYLVVEEKNHCAVEIKLFKIFKN